MYVKSHERLLPNAILAQELRIRDPKRSVGRSDSKGLLVLNDGDDRRKEGTTSLARQDEAYNRMARHNK